MSDDTDLFDNSQDDAMLATLHVPENNEVVPNTPPKRKIISLKDKLALNGSGKRVPQFRGSYRPSPYHKCPLKKRQDTPNGSCSNETVTPELSKAPSPRPLVRPVMKDAESLESPQPSVSRSPVEGVRTEPIKDAETLKSPRPSVSRLLFESVKKEPKIVETLRSSTPQSLDDSDKIDTDIPETPSILKGRSFTESERTDTPSPSIDEPMDALNERPLICPFLSQFEVPSGKTNGFVVDFKTAGNRPISVKGAKLEAIFQDVFKSENIIVKFNGEDSGNESYILDHPKEHHHPPVAKRVDCDEQDKEIPVEQVSSQGSNLDLMDDPLTKKILDEINDPFNSSMDQLNPEFDEFLGSLVVPNNGS